MFLLLPVERRYVFTAGPNIAIPAACWRTVNCDLITGEFVNPFDAEPSSSRGDVAHLLQGPAQDFVDWASNCAIADKLPVHALMPGLATFFTAQSRASPVCWLPT